MRPNTLAVLRTGSGRTLFALAAYPCARGLVVLIYFAPARRSWHLAVPLTSH